MYVLSFQMITSNVGAKIQYYWIITIKNLIFYSVSLQIVIFLLKRCPIAFISPALSCPCGCISCLSRFGGLLCLQGHTTHLCQRSSLWRHVYPREQATPLCPLWRPSSSTLRRYRPPSCRKERSVRTWAKCFWRHLCRRRKVLLWGMSRSPATCSPQTPTPQYFLLQMRGWLSLKVSCSS